MNLTHHTRHAVLAIGAAGALVLAGGGMAVASYSGASTSGQILACWNTAGVRIVDHFPCRSGESSLSWNQKGVKGDTGDAGDAGPGATGPAGATGLTGATGPAGAIGDTGATGATGHVGPRGVDGAPGEQGPQGEVGPQGPAGAAAATRSSGLLYPYFSGCSMYGNTPTVPPTKGGEAVAGIGSVTQTAPGTYHLAGLVPGVSYSVIVCSIGSVTQIAATDGTIDAVIRGYDAATSTQGAGFDGNGAPVQINWSEGNTYKYAATLPLTAPQS